MFPKNQLPMNEKEIILHIYNKYNAGLGKLFRILRKLPRLKNYGDIIIYKHLINTLAQAGIEISERSITRHFENVSKEDYSPEDKREIIKDIKIGADKCRSRSIEVKNGLEIDQDDGIFIEREIHQKDQTRPLKQQKCYRNIELSYLKLKHNKEEKLSQN